MPNYLKMISYLLLTLVALCSISAVQAQRSRLIKMVAHEDEPVELLEMKVAGRSIKPNTIFTADGEWMKGFRLKARNVSGKTIVHAEITLQVPKSGTMEYPLGLPVKYGQVPLTPREANNPPASPHIRHNEIFELTLHDNLYEQSKKYLAAHGITDVPEVEMYGLLVIYDDDTAWHLGRLHRRDPDNLRSWIPIK